MQPLTTDPVEIKKRQAFYDKIAPHSLSPLWEVIRNIMPKEPVPTPVSHIWRWSDVRPLVIESGSLLSAEEAERRVLVLENPSLTGQTRATKTLYAGIQLVLPGELAPAHRHSPGALRFVMESDRGYTSVGGERSYMKPGDFIITPSWSFHDHGNDGSVPVLWMDVLDIPMVRDFEVMFMDGGDHKQHKLTRPEGDALSRYGMGMVPLDGGSPYGLTSPIFNYPYERTRESLLACAKGQALDPHWGVSLRYANPLDGGWAMPTISNWMTYLPKGFKTQPVRSTDAMIVAVAEGSGSVTISGKTLNFSRNDVFVVPTWAWRSLEASEDSFLFFSTDRVIQEKLGLWREERQA
jgi:gentisate 1,2-dioxygenase